MRCKSLLALLALLSSASAVFSAQPQVTTKLGTVKGLYKKTSSGRTYSSFEGIPYAKPPEGKRRFKNPLPAEPWLGIYNATREPPKCLQVNYWKITDKSNDIIGIEDCLYINVYTPKLPTGAADEKPLDVIAFIHAGGFFMLYSTFQDPRLLLDRDIILVTFNYRLGPLGFLSTEDSNAPGNFGLKDQVLALKWIQYHIAAFGGNPQSVTVVGISAGGASCHLHLLSPLSKGLFKGAICMSGVSLNSWVFPQGSREKAITLGKELGCPTEDIKLLLKCLRKRPAEHIVSLTKHFWKWKTLAVPFAAVIEKAGPNAFISSPPAEILLHKNASDIPLLLTYTASEGLCAGAEIISNHDLFNELVNDWDRLMADMMELDFLMPPEKQIIFTQKIKKYYRIDNSTRGEKNLVKQLGDMTFLLGIGMAAKLHASTYTSPIYLSQFSYRGEHSFTEIYTKNDLGVSHCDDSIYLFGLPFIEKLSTKSDVQMSKKMVDIWVTFAANGTLEENWQPVSKHLPRLAYTDIRGPNNLKTMIVDEIGEEKFWKSLFSTLLTQE